MIKIGKRIAFINVFALFSIGFSAPAFAQATRTWVSGVGDDANPCSRTAPCKTFAGAISKTATAGEINCLDPGGWGALTITKSITIDCKQFTGGVLNAASNGITVNAGVNDIVLLRGLSFSGAGNGINGVRLLAGATLILDDVSIRGSAGANSTGILFAPSGASQLLVVNSTVSSNGNGSNGAGILIQPSGTGSAKVTLSRVNVLGNAGSAVKIDTTGNTGGGVSVAIEDSQLSGSSVGLSVVYGGAPESVSLSRSSAFNNGVGIIANGAGAVVRVSDSTLFNNSVAVVAANGGTIKSYGNNRTDGNASASSFTPPNLVTN